MRIATALSVLNKHWLIEPNAGTVMYDAFVEMVANKGEWKSEKSEGLSSLNIYSRVDVIASPDNAYDMQDFAGFEGATTAIIPVCGALMKEDYCGALGTSTIRSLVNMANNTKSVETILFYIDTPGGTVDGTQSLADAIKGSSKKTIGCISGMCCSAGYWIGSSCNELYASSSTDIIGSIGTMCQYVDSSKAREKSGYVLREYYATESVDKNRAGKEAMEGDGKMLIAETLDPLNNEFLATVKSNREGKLDLSKENVLTGKTYVSKTAMSYGLIDGIKSMEDIINQKRVQTKINTYSMTLETLKAEHPKLVEAVLEQEKDRVASWLKFNHVDSKAVTEGINSGKTLTQAEIIDFLSKEMHTQFKAGINADSKETPAKDGGAPVIEVNEGEAFMAEVRKLNETVKL